MFQEMPRIYWQPMNEQGETCLSVEVDGVKKYRRFWFLADGTVSAEWGWTIPEDAVELTL